MGSRNRSYQLVISLAAAALLGGVVGAHSVGGYEHPGQVLERKSHVPVVASITAWSTVPNPTGDCPSHQSETPLDTQISASDGGFAVSVEPSRRTYVLVYCANGFFPRTDRALNLRDRDPIVPMPAFIRSRNSGFPLDPGESQSSSEQAQPTLDATVPTSPDQTGSLEIGEEVLRTALYALNELAYLRSISEKEFELALSDYSRILAEEGSEGGAGALISLVTITSAWQK